ncbi:hypothetical protein Tco_0155156 [Tanacetum coccineum]
MPQATYNTVNQFLRRQPRTHSRMTSTVKDNHVTILYCQVNIQERHNLSLERSQTMDAQVTDLIKTGYLRPVQYQTWVANPILVKKHNGETLTFFSSLSGSHPFSTASRKKQHLKANLLLQQGPARCTSQLPSTQEARVFPTLFIKEIQAVFPGSFDTCPVKQATKQILSNQEQSIKGQIMADFLAELDMPATITTGSRAGLVLRSPLGHDFTYALKFDFDASNYESEYKALLAGLRIAKRLEVK